jgi:glutamate dehydrogenase (NAD(P)+)
MTSTRADQDRTEHTSALETARRQLDGTAEYVDLYSGIVERLKYPTRVVEVSVPLERDDGEVEVFTGYRAQHDDVPGAPTREVSGITQMSLRRSASGCRCG